MHSAPHDRPIRRRARRLCPGIEGRSCGNAARFIGAKGREKSDPQHDLCEACWRAAEALGNARGKKLTAVGVGG